MASVVALLLAAVPCVAVAADLHVTRITPSGEDVRAERQITISFDRAVVPLGRMERSAAEVPATVTPDPGCQWRWLDPQVLACNLPPDTALLPATEYRVEVRPELESFDGVKLREGETARFITERPALRYAYIVDWRGPEQPELRVAFNQPVTAKSVAAALRLGGEVEVGPEWFERRTPFHTPDGEARPTWRVWPRTPLRADRAYALEVKAGLQSAQGAERGIAASPEVALHTFPELRYLGIECHIGDGSRRFDPGETPRGCSPLEGIGLVFSAPIDPASVRERLKLAPDPRTKADEDAEAWPDAGPERVTWAHRADQTYTLILPFAFAAEAEYALELAAGVTDRFGRQIGDGMATQIATGSRLPRFVFDHANAVLESGIDSEVPAIVTNLQAIVARYTRMTASGLQPQQESRVPVAPARNVAFAMPLEMRGMIAAGSGAVRGELQSQPADGLPREFFAQVTPWQVHTKFGHANTLVWVTRFDDGTAVADAEVAVIEGFGEEAKASARTDADGLALLPGSAELDPALDRAWKRGSDALAVRVRKGKAKNAEFALLPLDYDFSVDTWRASREQISAWRRERHGHLRAWGTTAQGVYRAGDSVQYKLYVRDDAGRTLAAPPTGTYTLTVYDPTGTAVHERKDVAASRFGALDGEFALAKTAAVGWYRFELKPSYSDSALEPLRVLVADFVPAPFRVGAELRAKVVRPGESPQAVVSAQLHGGGPFANAKLRVLARLEAAPLTVEHPLAKTYQYDVFAPDARQPAPLLDREDRLDAQGEWQGTIAAPEDSAVRHGRIVLEGSVFDDRGRSIAASGSVPFEGRDRYIGVRYEGWVTREGRPAEVGALVIDADGTPQAGVPYYIKVERKQTRGARVKGAGNAYLTRYSHEWLRVETCKGRSRRDGMICRFTPDAAGEYRVIALVRDRQDRLHESRSWLYAQGRGEVLWEETPDYSLELRAEQARWKVGDTARYMVKNPFPGARALITVERYGVLDRRVQVLEGPAPVIEIPVQPEFVPGAYVSVVVISPRVEQPLKGNIDLGKPTFRMGYATLAVDEPYRRIDVDVAVKQRGAREHYRPRETVEVALLAKALHADGQPIEFAVAVLDEAVFDLVQGGSDYFDPLKGFTTLDPLDLANYSLLTRLVGRQKFEKKGANPGGDGGADLSLRSIERFVAYWNPALPADAHGRAQFSFALPDQLTGWRVLALATTPTDRMGLGQGGVKVSKPTELRPAMPNQVASGDRFDAAFTVLNRAAQKRTLEVEIDVQGGAAGQLRRTLTLDAFERQMVSVPVEVVRAEPLRFTARAGDGDDHDALAHLVPVRAPRVSATAADLASLVAGERIEQAIAVPATARSPRLELQLAPTLVGPLDGAFGYLRSYPYLCWEQRLSKALMAAHYMPLRERFGASFDWPEAGSLPQATLDEAAAFQAPGGGMAFFVPADAYVSPYLSAFTGLAFGWMQALDHAPPPAVWDKLDAYLQRLLREDPATMGYDSGEARAQLRAVVLAALAARGAVDAREIARHAPQLPRMGLFGEALFLQAAQQVEGSSASAQAARNRVLSRANESAGRLSLQDDEDAAWDWLLGSSMRSNCAALSALSALSALIGERDRVGLGELPFKLVRHVLSARGTKTHWANTQENLFCARALLDYANAYEAEAPDLQIEANLGDESLGQVRIVPGPVQTLARPLDGAAGALQKVDVAASGRGRAYVTTRVQYIEPDDMPALSAGLGVQRSYAVQRDGKWQPLQASTQVPLRLRRGELLKVELIVDAPSWLTYVVVDDPVPGGIEPVNPDLATASGVDSEALVFGDAYPYPFYHRELRHAAVRHYAEWLPLGTHRLVWVGQAVATGEFAIDRPHVEQMYDPDVYGNGVSARLIVEEMPQ